MIEHGANDSVAANHKAIRQLHVQPALGLALITAMAVTTAAGVFASFGALVWWLIL